MPRRLLVLLALQAAASHGAAGEIAATVVDGNGQPVADAVVIAVPLDAPIPPAAPEAHATHDQVDKQFVPHVQAVQVGSLVRFPNNDDVRHQVYSFSPAKQFELPLYEGVEAPPVLFDAAGPVALGCNIHDWMRGYLYVAETPYFATSGADGRARLTGLPAGRYEARVWHPRQQGEEADTRQALRIGEAATSARWTLELKPTFRPRRAPVGGGGGGYR